MDKQQAMSMLNCSVDSNSLQINMDGGNWGSATNVQTCWDYWQNSYYPWVIQPSYPVYVQERAIDKGQKAFEIIKMMNDKKLVNLKTVKDFIEIMDCLIKIL